MERQPPARRIFSLDEARDLLPEVKSLTSAAVRRVDELRARMQRLDERDPSLARLGAEIERTVEAWSRSIQGMGLEAKGLWLVDFDNGNGYYCWCYPEEMVSHFHDYDGGFRGRMKIV